MRLVSQHSADLFVAPACVYKMPNKLLKASLTLLEDQNATHLTSSLLVKSVCVTESVDFKQM